jgi:hypothetical protein
MSAHAYTEDQLVEHHHNPDDDGDGTAPVRAAELI